MTGNTLPAEYAFPAAITREQCEKFGAADHPFFITARICLMFLTQTSDELCEKWHSIPEDLINVAENIPAAIDGLKTLAEMLEVAQNRLVITGDITLNGVDEKYAKEGLQ